MTIAQVTFSYRTGTPLRIAAGAVLVGGWDAAGRPSSTWTETPMAAAVGPDRCPAFEVTVTLEVPAPTSLPWGVWLVADDGSRLWGIPDEVPDPTSTAQVRTVLVDPARDAPVTAAYTLTTQNLLGALPAPDGSGGIVFRVWAPRALAVEVVVGGPSGYVADDGHGEDLALPRLPMRRGDDGVWEATAADFAAWVGRNYLFRVVREDGSVAWRTDLCSRRQRGAGDLDPEGAHYDGDPASLDGSVSCSVVVDTRPGPADVWAGEFDPARPVPRRVEDLVIYELHVGALGFGDAGPNPAGETKAGTFDDAVRFVDYLTDLGVNAVELLPILEFGGNRSWGYGTSHFLAVEGSAGGGDGLRAFVKACHQRGIAVLMDLVFNHFTQNAGRAEWMYDAAVPSHNSYYWYEGSDADHAAFPDGGYVDNLSSGYAPRYSEAQVRALFVASAVALVERFHVDGFRLDQTTSIHLYNTLHADGSPVPAANIAGRKFLRQFCQTLRLVAPDVLLVAEDHSGWDPVTEPAATGGLGFDARWYVDFYHHLIGDKGEGPEFARLLHTAGTDPSGPLAMGRFAGALTASAARTVVYPESHDEAGNADLSERNILVAVNNAPLVGETRWYAEARIRCVTALSLLAAGTPMFLMGDEVGATKAYTYNHFTENKEDLHGLRRTTGAGLFAAHRDLALLRLSSPAARSRNLEVLHANDQARVIAFRRFTSPGTAPAEELLVVTSLSNGPFPSYLLTHPSLAGAPWALRLSTDDPAYRGRGDLPSSGRLFAPTADGTLDLPLPAVTSVILSR